MTKTLEAQREQWKTKEKFPKDFLKKSDFSNLEKQLLFNRGIRNEGEAKDFLNPDYLKLHDPFLLSDMKKAVKRIERAISKHEKVTVYGDYDADGLTSTVLILEVLTKLGLKVDYYIPDREAEGYGLNLGAINQIKEKGTSLIVTVDCGITAIEEVATAKERGIDFIITDHHSIRIDKGKEILPNAICLNPKRSNSKYPFVDLAGVGVAFKLVQALYSALPQKLKPGQEKWLLDLVAIGTICDVVPLKGENRIFTYYGLKVLSKTKRVGIKLLAELAGIETDNISAYNIGYQIGPRLNAVGRLETAEKGIRLLLEKNENKARQLALTLNKLNEERQNLTEEIVKRASELIEEKSMDEKIFLISDSDWPAGVVGIAASKLSEKYSRPVLVLEDKGEYLQGSARSPHYFSIIEALNDCSRLLQRYGGHARAAGLTVARNNLGKLTEHLLRIGKERIKDSDLVPIFVSEAFASLKEVSKETHEFIKKLEPFGCENPQPVFYNDDIEVFEARRVGKDQNHLKLILHHNEIKIKGIYFFYDQNLSFQEKVEALFSITENQWNQRITYEMKCLSVRKKK